MKSDSKNVDMLSSYVATFIKIITYLFILYFTFLFSIFVFVCEAAQYFRILTGQYFSIWTGPNQYNVFFRIKGKSSVN
jgi:hypothetical protein